MCLNGGAKLHGPPAGQHGCRIDDQGNGCGFLVVVVTAALRDDVGCRPLSGGQDINSGDLGAVG